MWTGKKATQAEKSASLKHAQEFLKVAYNDFSQFCHVKLLKLSMMVKMMVMKMVKVMSVLADDDVAVVVGERPSRVDSHHQGLSRRRAWPLQGPLQGTSFTFSFVW